MTGADRHHEHERRRQGPRRARLVGRRVARPGRELLGAAGRRRDVRRPAQRHRRRPRSGRARRRGPRGRERRPGRRGQRRWRDGHDLPRVQGRHRDGVAPGHERRRRLDRRGARPGELRPPRPAAHRRRAGRGADLGRRGSLAVGASSGVGAPRPNRCGWRRLDHRRGRDGRAAPAAPVRPARPPHSAGPCAGRRPRLDELRRHLPRVRDRQPRACRRRRRRPTGDGTVAVRGLVDRGARPAVRGDGRGDGGGDRQRARRGGDDDRARRDHGPSAAARPARRGDGPATAGCAEARTG